MAQASLPEDVRTNLEHLKKWVKENKYEEKIESAKNFSDDLSQIASEGNIETLKNCCVQMLDALKSVDKTVDKAVVEGFKKLLHEFLQGKRPTVISIEQTEDSKNRNQSIPINVEKNPYKGTQSPKLSRGSHTFHPSQHTRADMKQDLQQAPNAGKEPPKLSRGSHTFHPSQHTRADMKQVLQQAPNAGKEPSQMKGSSTLKPSSSTTKDLQKEMEQNASDTGLEHGDNTSVLLQQRTQELNELKKKFSDLDEKYRKSESMKEKLNHQCKHLAEEKAKETSGLNKRLEDKQNMIAQFEKTAEEHYIKERDFTTQLSVQQQEIERLQTKNDQLKDTLKATERMNSERIRALVKERDDLRNRYSKLAGQKLKDNSTDITDLSDPNRPTKSAEKFSELYDNEWTDAFQVQLDRLKKSEKEAIQFLLQVLEDCYTHCKQAAEKQIEVLKAVVLYHDQDMTKAFVGKEKPRLHSSEEKALLEVRKLITASKPGPAKQSFLLEIAKKYDPKAGGALTEIKAYFEKCVDVCWLLAVNDPPLYMDMACKQGTKIDQNLYTSYYTPGDKADFLVWPPLFSYHNGGLISKGVIAPTHEKRKIKK